MRLRSGMWLVLSVPLALWMGVEARSAHGAPTLAGTLQVSGSIFNEEVVPGQTYVHQMIVSVPTDSPPLDIVVEAKGMAQGPDGAIRGVGAAEDASPYSARQSIVDISPRSFRLEPGGSQEVNATISVPGDMPSEALYAVIHIGSDATGGGPVGFQVAVDVPVILNAQGATWRESGNMSEHSVDPVTSGQPIVVNTVLTNDGNRHYKARAEVRIEDALGNVVAERSTSLSEMSIVPTFSRAFPVSFGLLDRPRGLPVGQYWAVSRVLHEDGTELASRRTAFAVAAPFEPFPGLASEDVFLLRFANEVPGCVDSRPTTPLEVCFSDTGAVTGTLAIGRYRQVPSVATPFDAPHSDGGTEGDAVGYAAVRVDGFDQGTARLKWHYDDGLLGGIDARSLFMAYWNSQDWLDLDDLDVFTGATNVQGAVRVSALTKAPMVALGGDGGDEAVPLALVVGVAALILFLLAVAMLLRRRRRREPPVPQFVFVAPRAAPGDDSYAAAGDRAGRND